MGNPTGRIFICTDIEWYYPKSMYPLPSLSIALGVVDLITPKCLEGLLGCRVAPSSSRAMSLPGQGRESSHVSGP
jgi:hypothetical protein